MAQVVAFQTFAPRIARRQKTTGTNGDGVLGKIIIFTGVWHERVGNDCAQARSPVVKKPRK